MPVCVGVSRHRVVTPALAARARRSSATGKCGRFSGTSRPATCCRRSWCCRRDPGNCEKKKKRARNRSSAFFGDPTSDRACRPAYGKRSPKPNLKTRKTKILAQTLARNPRLTLGVVRDYVARQLERESAAIDEDRQAIAAYTAETERLRAEARQIQTQARVFQATKCLACAAPLEPPAVHFLCSHSFHQRCLGDRDCPACAPANARALELKRSMEAAAGEHEAFFSALQARPPLPPFSPCLIPPPLPPPATPSRVPTATSPVASPPSGLVLHFLLQGAPDGFAVVADFFGRGQLSSS